MRTTILLASVAILASPAIAAAQTSRELSGIEIQRLQDQVRSRSTIRIQVDSVPRIAYRPHITPSGRLVYAVAADGADSTVIPLTAVTEIQVRRTAALSGLKTGAIAGGIGGAVLGTLATLAAPFADNGGGQALAGAIVGGFAGAIVFGCVGALFALPFSHWSTVYRTDTRPALAVRVQPRATPRGAAVQLGASITF
jgi:hypothetical protein